MNRVTRHGKPPWSIMQSTNKEDGRLSSDKEDRRLWPKKMEDCGQNVADLPPEIMHDIFSRLPPKSLSRFKCVSKPWRSMISDHVFVAKYNKDVSRRRRLMFTSVQSTDHWLYALDLNKFIYENHNDDVGGSNAVPSELDFVYDQLPYGGLDCVPFIHYSYHGLFFSHYCSGCFSFNFIDHETKESEKLPDAKIRRLAIKPVFDHWHLSVVGLFDYSTNGYKVINRQESDDGVVFSVHTWNPRWSVLHSHGILVNGEVHWLATKKVGHESLVMIISIISAEEKVREIALPPNASTGSIELGAFKDWLCIISAGYRTCNEFWVMKEYGVRESWTKIQVSIPYCRLLHSGFWTDTHDLMVFDRSSFIMYNFSDETFWTLPIGNVGDIISTEESFFTIISDSTSQIYSLNLDQFLNENDHNIDGLVSLVAGPTELDIVCNQLVPEKGWQLCRPINVHGSCSGMFLSQLYSRDFSYSLIK
ncbi:hypothetical protein ACLB2K_008877 [Fragaria x ananassa]